MKRILIAGVMMLALAGGSVFAAQNSNMAGGKGKSTMGKSSSKGKHHRRHHKGKGKGKGSSKTMKGNKNM